MLRARIVQFLALQRVHPPDSSGLGSCRVADAISCQSSFAFDSSLPYQAPKGLIGIRPVDSTEWHNACCRLSCESTRERPRKARQDSVR